MHGVPLFVRVRRQELSEVLRDRALDTFNRDPFNDRICLDIVQLLQRKFSLEAIGIIDFDALVVLSAGASLHTRQQPSVSIFVLTRFTSQEIWCSRAESSACTSPSLLFAPVALGHGALGSTSLSGRHGLNFFLVVQARLRIRVKSLVLSIVAA
jgi:hypothetical protein